MKIENLINDALKTLYRINALAEKYRDAHESEYELYFFKRPHQRTKDFCDEISALLTDLSPKLIDYKKIEVDGKYKNKIGEIVLDLESDIEFFKTAPDVDADTKKLCDEAVVKIKEIEKEMGIKARMGMERKS